MEREQTHRPVGIPGSDLLSLSVLLIIALILFPLKGVAPSADSSWYLRNALKIYQSGSLDSLIIWRPLFPAMMALSFHLFEPGIQSGFYVVRFFYVLNLLLAYGIGATLFNRRTGIVFSLLLLTSTTINQWSSYVLLDHIVPFFVMLYILLVYLSMQKSEIRWLVFSGLSLGLMILLKPVMGVMFVPLPLCCFVFGGYEKKRLIKSVGLIYLTAFLLLLPWLHGIISSDKSAKMLLGPMVEFDKISRRGLVPATDGFFDLAAILHFVFAKVENLYLFTQRYIIDEFVLAPLLFIGLAYTLYRFTKEKSTSSGILFLSVLLFFPIVYVVAQTKIRTGQMMTLYFLFLLMAANVIVDVPGRAATYLGNGVRARRIRNMVVFVTAFACVSVQGIDLMGEMRGSREQAFSFWRGDFQLRGWANASVREAAEWILENLPEDADILCQWRYHAAIKFFTRNQYRIHKFQPIKLFPGEMEKKREKLGRLLFLWPRHGTRVEKKNYLEALFEKQLMRRVNKTNAKYIVVTDQQSLIVPYFDNHPALSLLESFPGKDIKIYQVCKRPIKEKRDLTFVFGENTYDYLRRLKEQKPGKWDKTKDVLRWVMRWPDQQIENLFAAVEEGKRDEFWRYVPSR